MPLGFVALLVDQRARPLARLEVGAKDLVPGGAQLLADQRLDGVCLVAAALLVVWRIGHYVADTADARSETQRGPRTGGTGRQSLAVTASSTAAKCSRAAARRVGTCSVGSSPAGGA